MAAAFGGAAQAEQALDEVYAIACAQAERAHEPADRLAILRAEAATRALFGEMRERYNLKPPAHAVNGLPKLDAQYSYLAVYQTLQPLRRAANCLHSSSRCARPYSTLLLGCSNAQRSRPHWSRPS